MKWSQAGKWIAGGFGLSLLLIAIIGLVSYRNVMQLIESSDRVKQTNAVLRTLTEMLADMTEAEAGRRGYILLGDSLERDRYYQAAQRLTPTLETLLQQIANDAAQQQRLVKLKSLVAKRLELSERSIALFQSSGIMPAQATVIAQLNQNRNQIRQLLAHIQSQEEQLLQMQVARSQSSVRYQITIDLLGTLLSFAILLGVYVLLHQEMMKRQQAEAVQHTLTQEKELGELKLNFFSMVSHEFRTPLSIILGSAQLLVESAHQWLGEKQQRNLHRIQSSAKLMTQLLANILTLTRAEAGKLECSPGMLDIESFCLNLVEDIQVSIDTQHSIRFASQGACSFIYVDEKLLYSILSNLISNAIKYSPQGSYVDFTLMCEPETAIFQIKDEGIGIPLDEQKALYEPFYRSKNVGDIAGSGLGLAVVKTCIELHQGKIAVESEEGVGTTFTIRIPQPSIVERFRSAIER